MPASGRKGLTQGAKSAWRDPFRLSQRSIPRAARPPSRLEAPRCRTGFWRRTGGVDPAGLARWPRRGARHDGEAAGAAAHVEDPLARPDPGELHHRPAQGRQPPEGQRFASVFFRRAFETPHGTRGSTRGVLSEPRPVLLTNGRSRSSEHLDGLNGRDSLESRLSRSRTPSSLSRLRLRCYFASEIPSCSGSLDRSAGVEGGRGTLASRRTAAGTTLPGQSTGPAR